MNLSFHNITQLQTFLRILCLKYHGYMLYISRASRRIINFLVSAGYEYVIMSNRFDNSKELQELETTKI